MGEYLKMSDVFNGAVGFCFHGDIFDNDVFFGTIDMDKCDAVKHAINSHDELVENMQHYKQEADRLEARATKEASRAQDLEVEVERLRCENQMLMKCRMAAREFFNCTVASGGSVKVSSASKAALDEADKASDWLEAELKATVDLVKK